MKKIVLLLILMLPILTNGQTNVIIEGIDSLVTSPGGFDIKNSSPTNLIFRNSYIESNSANGFIVRAGEDDHNAYANNLDGAKINGNKLYWDGSSGGTHGLMVGYSTDYDIKYNFIDNSKYGIIHEGGLPGSVTMINENGGIAYNVIKNCYMGLVEKGFDYTPIYNNTFYTNTNSLFFISVKSSDTGGYDAISKNIKIKNNIFYSTTNTPAVRLGSAGDDTASEIDTQGFECDYNIYYYPNRSNNEPVFMVNDQTVTWTEWRALGYDTNSRIVDPNFIDTEKLVPASKLEYGTNLGVEFENGLDTNAEWIVGTPPEAAKQPANWQVGAHIYTDQNDSGGGTPPAVTPPNSGNIGGDFFISPNGNDSGTGSIDDPWRTWNKAFTSSQIQPGDTVYFRGGVYYLGSQEAYGPKTSRSGTTSAPIYYLNYPNETPILDGNRVEVDIYSQRRGVQIHDISNVVFRGLIVRNIKQIDGETDTPVGWHIDETNNITFDRCTAANVWGIGYKNIHSNNVYYLNCDAYDCTDWITSVPVDNPVPGNDGSGFQDFNMKFTSYVTTYKDCRAWRCGDQGFSTGSIGQTVYDGCWSWSNGVLQGGGHGFKMGWVSEITQGLVNRIYRNCFAAFNRKRGWDTNDQGAQSGSFEVFNNTAYKNQEGFRIFETSDSQSNELRRIYRNNVAYANTSKDLALGNGAYYTHSNNSWDSNITLSQSDFATLDTAGLAAPRKADGSLPDMYALTLSSGSKLINRGTNVGLPYNGSAPDIGYAEYGTASNQPDFEITSYSPNPTYSSVTINYTSPSSTSIDIDVVNSSGSTVKSQTDNASTGNNQVSVDLSQQNAGTYSIRLDNGSDIISCDVTKQDQQTPVGFEILRGSPSPTVDLFVIEFTCPDNTTIPVKVLDKNDRVVLTEAYSAQVGMNKLVLNLSILPSGSYTIILTNNNADISTTVYKQDFL